MTMTLDRRGRSPAEPVFGRRDPDARGYFGAYGGRFVPETLVAPVAALERGVLRGARRRGVRRRARRSCCASSSAGRRRSTRRARLSRGRRLPRLPQARGPRAHRRAQDQQRARPGAAGPAHGQDAHRRRDRRRPARRRHGHRVRAARPRVRRLHGRRGHGAPGAERLPHAAARRRRCVGVDAGSRTLKDAINEAMRDWVATVARHLLPARLGARPASVSADGARVPVGHRPGGARSRCLAQAGRLPDAVVACVGGGSNAIGLFDAFIDDAAVRLIGVEAGGEGITAGPARGALRGRQSRRAAGHADLRAAGRGRQHRADALGLGRPRLRGDRPRARDAARAGPRRATATPPTPQALAGLRLAGAQRGHPAGARVGARDRRGARRRRARSAATACSSSTSRAAATRTCTCVGGLVAGGGGALVSQRLGRHVRAAAGQRRRRAS